MPDFTTNAGTDLAKAGLDFGSLIQGVGSAVAQTQLQLTQTSADSASTLANTLVDVIAVQETIYDDAGNVQGEQSFVQKLPLIDFIDPVFYQWTQVRLQGMFFVNEVASASDAKTSTSVKTKNSEQHGLLVILGGGQTGSQFSSNDTSTSGTFDQASAVGVARMYAQLNPRSDLGVPKPTTVIQGPSLNLVQGELVEVPGDGAPPTSRTLSLLIQLRRANGTPIANKAISIETDGTPWSFADPAKTTTDAAGNLAIKLQRTFPPQVPNAPPVDTSAKPVVVTVRLGLVSNNTTVTF